MNTITKASLALTLSILALLTCATTFAASSPDISGTYNCKYHDPKSTPPDGNETIVFKKSGDTYSVKMISSGSVVPYDYGTVVFNKDVNDAFTYIYWNLKDNTNFGAELMLIKPDGSLDGVFLNNGQKKPGTETCTKES